MDILQGALDLLILRALDLQPMHGVGVATRIEQVTRGALVVKPGSLFPALRRLEQRAWISGVCGPSENNRRAATTPRHPPAGDNSRRRSGTGAA
jgi:PadR family transcriptional regulator PadR